MTKKTKDIILISILTVILGTVFLVFQLIVFKQESSQASILYQNQELIIVDFDKKTYQQVLTQNQVNDNISDAYPIIQMESEFIGHITLIGDYESSEVVIEFNYTNKTMQVIKETSPRKVCSFVGASTFQPIECRPNNIRVIFKAQQQDHLDGEL